MQPQTKITYTYTYIRVCVCVCVLAMGPTVETLLWIPLMSAFWMDCQMGFWIGALYNGILSEKPTSHACTLVFPPYVGMI